LILMALGVWLIVAGVVAYGQDATLTPSPTLEIDSEEAEDTAGGVVDTAENAAETLADTAITIFDRLTQMPQSDVTRLILIVGGIVLLLAGWLIHDLIIVIAGFLIGGLIALSLVNESNAAIALILFLIGGIIGAAVAYFLWFAAVFLIGGYIGLVITRSLALAFGFTPVSDMALLVGLVIGGLILLILSFEFLIIFSAIVGAQMVAVGFGLGVEWVILLAILGVIAQFVLARARGVEFRRRSRRLFPLRRPGTVSGGMD
jgi:hypothetical protein